MVRKEGQCGLERDKKKRRGVKKRGEVSGGGTKNPKGEVLVYSRSVSAGCKESFTLF